LIPVCFLFAQQEQTGIPKNDNQPNKETNRFGWLGASGWLGGSGTKLATTQQEYNRNTTGSFFLKILDTKQDILFLKLFRIIQDYSR
jgi:hypothetical protein